MGRPRATCACTVIMLAIDTRSRSNRRSDSRTVACVASELPAADTGNKEPAPHQSNPPLCFLSLVDPGHS
jgi:hypothetical protein